MQETIIGFVKTYRESNKLSERKGIGLVVYAAVRTNLRLYFYSRMHVSEAEDLLQEVLCAILVQLDDFEGNTDKEFWKWCYQIARFNMIDKFRKKATDRLQPLPFEELNALLDASSPELPTTISPEVRLDLEYALGLLEKSKPECRNFLWLHFVNGMDYAELAEEFDLNYDAVRMKINRCLDTARALV